MAIQLADTLRTDNNTYPIAVSEEIKGGIRGVETVDDLLNITDALISTGMLVWVNQENSYYKYTDGKWSILKTGSDETTGILMFTSNQIKILKEQNALPELYIWIRTKDEIDYEGEITDNIYKTTKNGNYIDILFQAIRLLQTEVAKMRNTFKYGMYSCTNKEMAISNVVDEMKETAAEEPLWAIEEDGLSYIESLDMQEKPRLFIDNNESTDAIDNTSGTYLDITSNLSKKLIYWSHQLNSEDDDLVGTCEDPKLFMYLTVGTRQIGTLKYFLDFSLELSTNNKESKILTDICFKDLLTASKDTVNIMLLLNRKLLKNEQLYGNNYLYVSISDYITNNVILSGYYNPEDKQLHKDLQDIGDQYYFNKVYFGNIRLSKFTIYSRYLDFTKFINETDKVVKPNIPNDSDYRYKVAHITIRSVTDETELLEIKQYLPSNELIWVEETRTLWIKTKNKVIQIGGNGSSNDDNNKDNMTQEELIKSLLEMGIVYESDNGLELQLAKVEDITFVNSNLSEKYVYSIDSEGNLHSAVIPKITLKLRIIDNALYDNITPGSKMNIRGFVANLVCKESGKDATSTGAIMDETDRIHISQFYAPLSTDIIEGKIGCSHAFIELTNTSKYDFQLDGCYIHFFSLSDQSKEIYYKLALKGVIPAGNTFLIRGKKYTDYKNSNVFIKVNSYDLEWFTSKDTLLDLTVNVAYKAYGIALTYGDTVNGETITPTTILAKTDSTKTNLYVDNYIDGILYAISSANIPESHRRWAIYNAGYNVQSNSLFRETFLLDPSKLGFQALQSACKDTSRSRHAKDTDFTMLSLANEFIEFPKSYNIKAVSDYTPKASFEHKTVITEKSNIDLDKPNMITCAFGINMLTTRCFNWISGGIFDEFIWIREKGTSDWICRYESYTSSKCTLQTEQTSDIIIKKTFDENNDKLKDVKTYIYDRITGIFPGTKTQYTSHKVIVNMQTPISGIKVYEYCVGRSLLDGTPDPNHSNLDNLYTFTMYANTYIPRLYQTSDQQGFHWIEYQVWTGAAIKLNEYIDSTKGNTYIPVLVNTGDMTQSGSRISEWYDYYEAGKCLFNHLELMYVVGNNDLANIDPTILGTGDDAGKSNSFYFHVFYCYEVDDFGGTDYPIINKKYIPSLYYFGTTDYRFIMVNSEITSTCCNQWFNLDNYNIYTGYTIESSNNTYKSDPNWTPIYDRLFSIMDNFTGKQFITACHEMPFTVITKANIKKSVDILKAQRSASGTSLVGSHLNSITADDTGYGFNWFSRLLEYFANKGKTKLCIGGHKHTYAMSFPIRENYSYIENGILKYSKDNPMNMSTTLNNELERSVNWTRKMKYEEEKCIYIENGDEDVNTSKLPYIPKEVYSMNYDNTTTIAVASKTLGGFLPYQYLSTLTNQNAVTYLMCQATGYKYSSNKELPAYTLAFSELIPQTTAAEKPSATQKYPMFIDIILNNISISFKLIMVDNIFGDKQLFTQKQYGTKPSELKYMKLLENSLYGKWVTEDTNLKTL